MNSDKFIEYEVVYWIAGFLVRRTLATFVFPYFSMATYESAKDISLLFTKIAIAKTILTSRTGKENDQRAPQTSNKIEIKDLKDGKPQN